MAAPWKTSDEAESTRDQFSPEKTDSKSHPDAERYVDDDAPSDDFDVDAFDALVRDANVRNHDSASLTESTRSRLLSGGDFVFSTGPELEPRWGAPGGDVLWARGESLLVVAPPGAGKTTIAIQLGEALIGITDNVLGLPVLPATKVLYLAMDRPRQISRAMRRRFGDEHRRVLDERLVVLKGPLPTDLSKQSDQILNLAREAGADVVIIDSLKDACAKLTDDESGSMVNRAIQLCNAADIDVLVLHHQRKGQGGIKPNKLEDVYGSTWLTAGAGSVILLWGEAGSEVVELSHLKQPADPVGPWTIEHDHHRGTSKIARGFDALAFLRAHPGATVSDAAHAEHASPQKSGTAPWKRTERRLRKLVADGLARVDARQRTNGTFDGARYWPADTPMDTDFTMDIDHGQGV